MNIITKFKDILIETLKENKKIILIFYIILIATAILTMILTKNSMAEKIQLMSSINPVGTHNMSGDNALSLFIHNELGAIETYITSVFFGISAIITLIYNGFTTGTYGNLFGMMIPNGFARYIIYLIPHGIFEYTATVIESVAGIILFKFVWNFLEDFTPNENTNLKPMDKWILSKFNEMRQKFINYFDKYEVGLAMSELENYFWNFCDNYIELVKVRLYNPDIYGEESKESAQYSCYYVLLEMLKMFGIYLVCFLDVGLWSL